MPAAVSSSRVTRRARGTSLSMDAAFSDIDAQQRTGFAFAAACPTRHYARKNVGYLAAMRDRRSFRIVETDDDNWPFGRRSSQIGKRQVTVQRTRPTRGGSTSTGTSARPRFGRADCRSTAICSTEALPPFDTLSMFRSAIVRFSRGWLPDENPDVDAVHRLAHTATASGSGTRPPRWRLAPRNLVSVQQPEYDPAVGRLSAPVSAGRSARFG